jgi:hypothetical protein
MQVVVVVEQLMLVVQVEQEAEELEVQILVYPLLLDKMEQQILEVEQEDLRLLADQESLLLEHQDHQIFLQVQAQTQLQHYQPQKEVVKWLDSQSQEI